MNTNKSINHTHRLDSCRKALIKELENKMAKQNIATPKRVLSNFYDDHYNLDTLRKKQHMDINLLKDRKLNEMGKK